MNNPDEVEKVDLVGLINNLMVKIDSIQSMMILNAIATQAVTHAIVDVLEKKKIINIEKFNVIFAEKYKSLIVEVQLANIKSTGRA